MTDLEARIDRLESLDAIRQLPAKYALALDMRDMEATMRRKLALSARIDAGAAARAIGEAFRLAFED